MKVANFSLSRLQLATFVLALCFMPWLRGGRDAAGLVVVYACLLIGYLLSVKLLENHHIRISKLAAWAVAFIAYGGLSIFWSVNRYLSFVWLLTMGLCILAAMLGHTLAARKGGWAVFRRCYLEIAAIIAVIGIWIFITSDYDRLTSLFYWANPAATFLLPALFISVWRFVKSRGVYDGMLAGIISTAFVLTYSRASVVVLIATMLVLIAWEKPNKAECTNILFIMILCLVAVLGINRLRTNIVHNTAPSQAARFAEAVKGESTSLTDRLFYLRSGIWIWAKHPVVGSGAGTYGVLHPQYQYRVISAGSSAHNVYAQWVSELGLIGAILMAGMFFELFKGLRRRTREQPAKRAAVLGLVAMLAHLGLDIGASFPAVLLLAAILMGYLYVPRHVRLIEPIKLRLYWPVAAVMTIGFLPLLGYYSSLDHVASAQAAQNNGDLAQAAGEFQAAHLELVYNPDTITGEGINDYVMAVDGYEPVSHLMFARMRAEAAIKQDPMDAQHWFLLARVARVQKDATTALWGYKHALELDKYNHPLYYSDLADYYLSLNQNQSAIDVASSGLELYTPTVLSNRGQDESLRSQVARVYVARANAYIADGQIEPARSDLAEALMTDKANTSAKRILATLPAASELTPYLPSGAGQSLEY